MPMNNRLLVPRKVPGLLDLVPGAAAAYSLRSLSNSYAGPVVTVRRSSDDAEEDFTAAEVADGTLAAFCGAGDGFVYRWWDQSGNANHAVAAADANEPQIVDSGVVVTEEGKPAVQFDGVNDYLVYSPITLSTYVNIAVCSRDAESTDPLLGVVSPNTGNSLGFWTGGNVYENSGFGGLYVYVPWPFDTKQHINIVSKVGNTLGSFAFRRDAVPLGAFSGTPFTSITITNIGARVSNGFYFGGKIQEVIVYPKDVTPQTELIEGNISWGWSV